ncbi:cell wall hydrolase [Sphingobium bisphenolivorans]|uniref:cell wall hydrolase n=1 Tax=Sphingobium bisphenolivorans TaxID=1335760 RepID=UPI0003B58331|nr:cell wall hydrolase [Sphingobium bisphenolivorans]
MTEGLSTEQPHPAMWLLWLALFIGLPALIAAIDTRAPVEMREARFAAVAAARLKRPPTPPPPVDPVEVFALEREQARAFNAAIPFSRLPNPAARPFIFAGSETDLARAIDCLAAAQLYEAGDDAIGERAVAQVVLNRVRHPAFPKTVCGVVFQGQERATGCQFTFTCDGALGRTPTQVAWERAREIARSALAGKVFKPVGYATHYHTDWVVPYWSGSLDKITAVGTHLFFRWRGWWGTPPAFRRVTDPGEPLITRIARLSAAHQDGAGALPGSSPLVLGGDKLADLTARPQQMIGAESLGKVMAGVRLVAIAPGAKSFLVELDRSTSPDSWPALSQTFCAGRLECRIMAWQSGSAPRGLPLTDENMEAMAFAYIHNSATGLQRSLWNCGKTQRANKDECMRQRIPAAGATEAPPAAPPALTGVRRKERFETIKVVPPVPVAPVVVVPPAKP